MLTATINPLEGPSLVLDTTSLVIATDLLTQLPAVARHAERGGLHRVWTTEFHARDALSRALATGLATDSLQVGTGIAYGFTRSPRSLAVAALDVQELCGGRFTLGLGAGTRGLRRRHGVEFDPPAPRLAEVIRQLREVWTELDAARRVATVPVAVGAVNAVMLRYAAACADRVLLHPLCLLAQHLTERVEPALTAGTERNPAGRPAVSAWLVAAVDSDVEHAYRRVRKQLAFYLSTPGYRQVLEGSPEEAAAQAIREGFAGRRDDPDWDALADLVPDDLVTQVGVAGTAQDVRQQLKAHRARLAPLGVDELVLQTTPAAADEPDSEADAILQLIDAVSDGTPARVTP